MEGQHSALVTQGRPCGSEQKHFNVLLRRSRRRPDANLSALTDLEIRNVFYPDKGAFCGVLKYIFAYIFRYGRMASRDLNHDIETPPIGHRRWQVGEWDLGPRVPATEHIRVGGCCAEVWLRRQWNLRPGR